MKKRRDFLKLTAAITGVGVTGYSSEANSDLSYAPFNPRMNDTTLPLDENISLIGPYGPWATSRMEQTLPSFSFRKKEWKNPEVWRKAAKQRLTERLAVPDIGGVPEVKVNRQYTYDTLHIEEISWQLPYGQPTEAIVLKPAKQNKPLPGILAFHDHSGDKYFGSAKITQTSAQRHPMMEKLQQELYSGLPWANEIAKRGYVVLVPDAFAFGSRRVRLRDVPEHLRKNLIDPEPADSEGIRAYNDWAKQHEHIMAKSLFSAGTTWPGVFFAEDQKALDVLCARKDVDANRIGCGGLSGGGLRTVMLGGLHARITCAVCVGFMTTWKDFALNKSSSHTWMTYVPLLPNELEFPEILGLHTPLPALVQCDEDDKLFTLSEMRRADEVLSEVYKKAKASDRYKGSFHPGPHKFDAPMQAEAFEWFDQWLKS